MPTNLPAKYLPAHSVYSIPKHGVELGRGFLLHRLGDVTVEVHRRSNCRMAEPFLYDLRMHPEREQLGCRTVAQVVKSDTRQVDPAHQYREFMRQTTRLQRLAIGSCTNKRIARLPNAEHQQFLGLLQLEPAQFFYRIAGQRDRPFLVCLRRFETQPGTGLFKACHDSDRTSIKIDVAPAQRQNLAAAHPCRERDQHGPVDAAVPQRVEKRRRLLRCQSRQLVPLDFGEALFLEHRGRVTGDKLILYGPRKRAVQDGVYLASCPCS
jgi:hypothetical protein